MRDTFPSAAMLVPLGFVQQSLDVGLDDQWARAPIETLASLLDDSSLGGA